MFAGFVTTAILSLASFTAAAMNESSNYKYSVDPDSIDPSDRASYCQSQNNVCTEVCTKGLQPGSPFCNSTTLMWTCSCANGPTPNLADFNGTIPFFECQEYIAQCQMNNTGDASKQHQCLAIQCGGKNASAYSASRTGSSPSMPSKTPMSKSGSGSGSGGSSGGSGSSSPKNGGSGGSSSNSGGSMGGSHSAATALEFGKSYGLATMVVAGMLTFGLGLDF